MNTDTTKKVDYIILDEFKGGYTIALKSFIRRETNKVENYVGIIDENLNEVAPFRFREEGPSVYSGNLRIELGEWVQDEEEYCYKEAVYKYIADRVYLWEKDKKIINFNNEKANFPYDIEVIEYLDDLNLLLLHSKKGYGLGDINGNVIISPIYQRDFSKFYDYIEVKNIIDGIAYYGLIDYSGNIVVKPQFKAFIDLKQLNTELLITAISIEDVGLSTEEREVNKKNSRLVRWEDCLINKKVGVLCTIIIEDSCCKSINYLPIRCSYKEIKGYCTMRNMNVYMLDKYISSTYNCLYDDTKQSLGNYGVCDIYGNTIIPYKYGNQILPVKIKNNYYFIWGVSNFFGSSSLGLIDDNNKEVLKCEFSKLYESNGELYGEKDSIAYKIDLDKLTFDKIEELPKIPNSDNKYIDNNKDNKTKLESISLKNVDVRIKRSDNYICFSSGERERRYDISGYSYKIEKFTVANKEYIFFPRVDYNDLKSNVIVLNDNLDEIIDFDLFANDIYLETNIANTNCFRIVKCFISPNEDIMRSSEVNYIYDESFILINTFDGYTRINIHEILNGNSILNLDTKESRDYIPMVISKDVNVCSLTDITPIYNNDDFEVADLPF